MGKIYEEITDRLAEFIEAQHMFFVATAPKKEDGLVNVSPKGYDSFRILGPRQVGYLDMTGSGVETIAHVKENGRLTIMFVAFEGPALILRLYGNAKVFERGDDGYDELLAKFPELPGTRSIIVSDLFRITDSCGWSIPFYEYQKERPQLIRYAESFDEEGLLQKHRDNCSESLDGLVGVKPDL